MTRLDGRRADELRPLKIDRHFTDASPGSVKISAGKTIILCTASFVDKVPPWLESQDQEGGWLTAEYRMLPGSTSPRSNRSDRPDGRATEIQRLIGRSLRAVVDLKKMGKRTLYIDCDVLQADGGTRTLSITGAYIAMIDAFSSIQELLPDQWPVLDSVAAVSIGIVNGEPLLDLCYQEDFAAEVDMNLVMTGSGRFIEIQGTGEEATFSEEELFQLIKFGKNGIDLLTKFQTNIMNQTSSFSENRE
ncbi:MAG: ribonuclease PH [Planctomycetia bacterium]|nr:ribonuclease PH [Planctomycetia bacterium]